MILLKRSSWRDPPLLEKAPSGGPREERPDVLREQLLDAQCGGAGRDRRAEFARRRRPAGRLRRSAAPRGRERRRPLGLSRQRMLGGDYRVTGAEATVHGRRADEEKAIAGRAAGPSSIRFFAARASGRPLAARPPGSVPAGTAWLVSTDPALRCRRAAAPRGPALSPDGTLGPGARRGRRLAAGWDRAAARRSPSAGLLAEQDLGALDRAARPGRADAMIDLRGGRRAAASRAGGGQRATGTPSPAGDADRCLQLARVMETCRQTPREVARAGRGYRETRRTRSRRGGGEAQGSPVLRGSGPHRLHLVLDRTRWPWPSVRRRDRAAGALG